MRLYFLKMDLAPSVAFVPAVSNFAPALVDGFSGLDSLSAPVESGTPALAAASTPVLNCEFCHDELRDATEVPTVRFRLHDEWLFLELMRHVEGASSGN